MLYDFYLGRFRTFSNGILIGKEKLAFNYTQIIQCTPNEEHLKTIRAPVKYLKQLYTSNKRCLVSSELYNIFIYHLVPIYNEDEEQLEWFAGPILESKDSLTCPNGFESKHSFCQGIYHYLKNIDSPFFSILQSAETVDLMYVK
jgi:hypothetical protein